MPIQTKVNEDTAPKKAVDQVIHEDKANAESLISAVPSAAADEYAKDLAFMAEPVEVMILESQDSGHGDTTRLVTIGVNGNMHYLLRGQWSTVPRYVLEILAKAKKQAWTFSYKRNPDGSTSDVNQMHRILRYPHQFRDKNPEGVKWYESIRDRHL